MIVYDLFVHKKISFKEKSLYYFIIIKNKILKKPKKNQKKFFVGFLGGI
jgi:hypothetical protein